MIVIFSIVIKAVSLIVPVLVSVAYFTVAERKVMGAIQRRKGPNVIGFLGLMQPFADGLKLFSKETIVPTSSDYPLFIASPIFTFFSVCCVGRQFHFQRALCSQI